MKPVVDSRHPTLRASRMGPPGKGRQPDTKCHQMSAPNGDDDDECLDECPDVSDLDDTCGDGDA